MAPRALIAMGDTAYGLSQISTEEMSGVLEDEKMRLVRGIPQYFDASRRVWPLPVESAPPVVFLPDDHETLRKMRENYQR